MPPKKSTPNYLQYAGLGFEVLACILLFAGAGHALDRWLATDKPWFLLVLALVGCAFAIYLLVRRFNNLTPS